MSQRLRPLLPNPSPAASSTSEGQSSSRGKRLTTVAACEPCRKRKSRCPGERPQCSVCVERQLRCEYTTLPTETHLKAQKRRLSDLEARCQTYEELFDILRTQPESTSSQILQRIRAGTDVETVVKAVRDSNLLMQLALQPEYRSRYELPYLDGLPASSESRQNPHLRSTLYEKLRDLPPNRIVTNEILRNIDDSERMYLMPYHAVELVDPQITAVDVSQWTTVNTDNTLLRALLKAYFVFEYPFHTYFNKDSFLEDMRNGRTRFCSSLLVNAVLAGAWHGYRQVKDRAEYWRPESLGYRFLAEARRLFELERANPTITTIQAAAIINLTCNTNGIDEIGWTYLHVALEMAKTMRLFEKTAEGGEEWQVVAVVTAWGLFNWQAFATWHTFQPPFLPEPPAHPLPELGDGTDPYGEILLQYPHARQPVAAIHGLTFVVISQFRVIMNDAGKKAWTLPRGPNRATLTSVLSLRARLLKWYGDLPDILSAKNVVLPCHLKLHMQYHILLISLFEPFIGQDTPPGEESMELIISDAKACFETLLRIYYLRHGFESYDPTLFQYLPMMAYSALQDLRFTTPGSQQHELVKSTVALCAKGLCDQGRCYYSSEVILRLLLQLADPEVATFIRKYTEIEEANESLHLVAQEIRSKWPIGAYGFPPEGEFLTLSRFVHWWKANQPNQLGEQVHGSAFVP